MQLNQERVFPYHQQRIWDLLLDMQQVQTLIPLITKIEQKTNDNNAYIAHASLSVGPLTGGVSADLSIVDKQPTNSFSVKVLYSSFLGKAIGDIDIELLSLSPQRTKLFVKGTVKMRGLLGAVGYRIQPATVDSLMAELFNRLARKLRQEKVAVASN